MPLTPEQLRECAALKALFLEKAGMSQRAFVKKHDMGTPANLSQYLQGRRAVSLEVALKMSNALGVPVEDFSPRLANRINKLHLDNNVEPVRHRMKLIPVISEVQAGMLTENGQVPMAATCIQNGDSTYVDEEMPDGTFGMILVGDSMEPIFLEGDTIIVDPTLCPKPGDFVVAQRSSSLTDGIEGTFKKYRPRGINENGQEVFELVPLNPDYPTIRSDREQCTIVGVMVEHRRRYRRR